jgi:twitching motility protein PilT
VESTPFVGTPASPPYPAPPVGLDTYAPAGPATDLPPPAYPESAVAYPAPAYPESAVAYPAPVEQPPLHDAAVAGYPAPAYVAEPPAAPAESVEEPAAPAAAPTMTRGTEQGIREGDFALTDALGLMLDRGASDLHLTTGARPTIRVSGSLVPLDDFDVLTAPVLQRVLYAIITQAQRLKFEEELELDFAYSLPGRARFRVNLYKQRDALGAAFRVIPFEIKSLESLGVPPTVSNFAGLPRGFVLVTGPTGSGKSTTLASLVDLANRTRHDHIMTVEDPIEFLHRHKSCLVNQREVGEDTHSFASALKHVLRQDPDIILVGEMRDLETISVALTAAETGHLVFATLHTQDAAQTIDRVIDVFPPHQQQQVRQQLAMSLQGVVCQTLCKTADGHGRVVATEVLVVTPAVRNLIREGKTHQIYSVMQAGAQHGMHTLDQHLAELVRTRRITYETGVEKCHHIEDFNRLVGRG